MIGNLFERALSEIDEDSLRYGDPVDLPAIVRLHRLASREVLDAALTACTDAAPLRRRVGAAVLGQLGHVGPGFEPVFVDDRYFGLAALLEAERTGQCDPDVLSDACVALGHLRDRRAIPALLGLLGHPDAKVRRGVASGLSGHDAPEAVGGLIALSSDADDDIRDWATFGLAQLVEVDTPALRAALRARLDDPCIDVRNEAIEGLATRGDPTVLPVLIRELQSGVALPLLDAATALASPDLCDALAKAATDGLVVQAFQGPYDLSERWKEAMRACGCQAPVGDEQRLRR